MTIKFCKYCVVNNLRPVTKPEHLKLSPFDNTSVRFVDGVCPACEWSFEKKNIDWDHRWRQLEELCDTYRSSDHSHDVIVPSSGGKDSRFVAHVLKSRLGMNPITITWAPNLWTDIGTANFRSQTNLDIPNLLVTPPTSVHRSLTSLAFTRLGHPFQPFSIGQKTLAPRLAIDLKIPLIIYGENVAEYTNAKSDNYLPDVQALNFLGFDLDSPEFRIAGLSLQELSDLGITKSDLQVYAAPSKER